MQNGAPYATPEQVQKNYEDQFVHVAKQYHRFAFAEQSRHFIMADAPEWLVAMIQEFITEL